MQADARLKAGATSAETKSHLTNGQPSRLANSDSHSFDSGAEGAAAWQPRATPWVSESIGAPCKGAGITLRPCRAEEVPRTRPRGVAPGWHAPRRWRVNAAEFSIGENCYGPIYEIGAIHASRITIHES